ncbi:hypothetical protein Tco_1552487, partial [Tanacetum coccineum]
ESLLGADEELSDRRSPRVIIYGYDGIPMQLVALLSQDYVPGPEHLPSPDYVPDSDPDEDPKEDPEDDHADYPTDRGDDDDEPFDDDDDDDDTDDEDKEPFEDEDDDEEEEEEHLALANSSAVAIVDLVPSAGDTKAFEMDESAPMPRSR